MLARNEERGLRCIFHGWKVDVTGQVKEAPTHSPNPELFAAKITTRHYPTVEGGGLVWVRLGNREAPLFPHLPFTTLPANQVWVTATNCACNWLQGVEATLDTPHIGTVQKAYIEAYSEADAGSSIKNSLDSLAPRYDVEHTSYGLDAIGVRPMPDGSAYVRTTKYVLPFVSLVPGSPGSAGGDVDGVIFDRTREHLSSSDVAIIHARRVLLDALDNVEAGRAPVGAGPAVDHLDVVPTNVVLPPEQPKGVAPKEVAKAV